MMIFPAVSMVSVCTCICVKALVGRACTDQMCFHLSLMQDKRARKFMKKRLGTLKRAKAKVEALQNVIAEQRRAGH